MEAEAVLKHIVETLIAQGYEGLLLILDEVSLFMKNRTDDQRVEDEKTLVVLSNRLAKTHCLPVWTICSAQQALESKMGVKTSSPTTASKRLPAQERVELLRHRVVTGSAPSRSPR